MSASAGGAAGGVNGGANIFPELYVEQYEAALAGNMQKVKELQTKVMAVATSLYTIGRYGSSYLKGVKGSLSLLGVCSDYMPYPYRKFRSEERAKVREALEKLGAEIKNP